MLPPSRVRVQFPNELLVPCAKKSGRSQRRADDDDDVVECLKLPVRPRTMRSGTVVAGVLVFSTVFPALRACESGVEIACDYFRYQMMIMVEIVFTFYLCCSGAVVLLGSGFLISSATSATFVRPAGMVQSTQAML